MTMKPSIRLTYLDALRAALILLIVLEHASIPYTSAAVLNLFDCSRSTWFVADVNALNDSYMFIKTLRYSVAIQLIFFISGFFFEQSVSKHGFAVYIKSRLIRIGGPLLLIALVFVPLMSYTPCLLTWSTKSFFQHMHDLISQGRWYLNYGWFLWTLLIFNGFAVLWRRFATSSYLSLGGKLRQLTQRPLYFLYLMLLLSYIGLMLGALSLDKQFALFWKVYSGPFAILAANLFISFAYYVVGLLLGQVNDIPIVPQNAIFCRVLFAPRGCLKLANRMAITCVLNDPWEQKSPRHKSRILKYDGYTDYFSKFAKRYFSYPWVWAGLSILLLLLQSYFMVGSFGRLFIFLNPAYQINVLITPLLSITLSMAGLSIFYNYLNISSKLLRFLSQSSYTVYIFHMPFIVITQYFLFSMSLPTALKMFISIMVAVGLSLVIYAIKGAMSRQ